MALVAYNLTAADITLTVMTPNVVLPASTTAGQRGPGVNVTSELRPNLTVDPNNGHTGGLTGANFTTLQTNVAAGNTTYVWTGTVDYLTTGLTTIVPAARSGNVVQAVTAAVLPAYGRVADVITETAANGALPAVDGVTLLAGERLLLKDGAAGADNGIYVVTQVGDGASKFILTRDLSMAGGEDASGMTAYCAEGTANANKTFVCTDVSGAAIVNTSALTFAHLHGNLATANTHPHDTTQIDNLSTVAGATATAALDNLASTVTLGCTPKEVVRLATLANVVGTRAVDVITGDAVGVIADIDGVVVAATNHVLLMDQTNPIDNGVYVVTDIGTAGTPFVLTRRTDFANAVHVSGFWVEATAGTQAGRKFVATAAAATDTINTHDPMIVHFSG